MKHSLLEFIGLQLLGAVLSTFLNLIYKACGFQWNWVTFIAISILFFAVWVALVFMYWFVKQLDKEQILKQEAEKDKI